MLRSDQVRWNHLLRGLPTSAFTSSAVLMTAAARTAPGRALGGFDWKRRPMAMVVGLSYKTVGGPTVRRNKTGSFGFTLA